MEGVGWGGVGWAFPFFWMLTARLFFRVSLAPVPSVRRGSAGHLRGSGRDADGPARLALPGALHSAHQPHRGAVPQGVAPVLDWEWICGEYQFDMTAKHPRTKKQNKKNNLSHKKHLVENMQSTVEF